MYLCVACTTHVSKCAFTPRSCYRWQSPSGSVIKARGRVKVVEDCHLMINSVDTSDAGNYTCYVSNMAATKSVTVMLTVAGARCHVHVMLSCLRLSASSSSSLSSASLRHCRRRSLRIFNAPLTVSLCSMMHYESHLIKRH